MPVGTTTLTLVSGHGSNHRTFAARTAQTGAMRRVRFGAALLEAMANSFRSGFASRMIPNGA